MVVTTVLDAKTNLSTLIELVLQGEEVIIEEAGKPVAKLAPYDASATPRQLGAGAWKGRIWIADDFDDLPAETVETFCREAGA